MASERKEAVGDRGRGWSRRCIGGGSPRHPERRCRGVSPGTFHVETALPALSFSHSKSYVRPL